MQKRYWLREGVIGFGIGIIISLIFSYVSINGEEKPFFSDPLGVVKQSLRTGLFLFILGAIIGWINTKVQERKKKSDAEKRE